MRIAISAETNNGLDSIIGQHFGRCPYFALVDMEGNEVKSKSLKIRTMPATRLVRSLVLSMSKAQM